MTSEEALLRVLALTGLSFPRGVLGPETWALAQALSDEGDPAADPAELAGAAAAAHWPELRGPMEAALVNGVLAHSDETDDSHGPSQSHPGAAVVPAALAKATLRRVWRLGGACSPAGEVGETEVMAISFDVSLDARLVTQLTVTKAWTSNYLLKEVVGMSAGAPARSPRLRKETNPETRGAQ